MRTRSVRAAALAAFVALPCARDHLHAPAHESPGAAPPASARPHEPIVERETCPVAGRTYRDRPLPVPASVACGLARALTAVNDRGGTPDDQREARARALANCQAAAPIGSVWADQAVAGLAAMAERGLDPAA